MTTPDASDYLERIGARFAQLRAGGRIGDALPRGRGRLTARDRGLVVSWQAQGIPLDCVLEALDLVFERRRERGDKSRVNSLSYCRWAVEEAWRDRQHLEAGAARATTRPAAANRHRRGSSGTTARAARPEPPDPAAALRELKRAWLESDLFRVLPEGSREDFARGCDAAGAEDSPGAIDERLRALGLRMLDLAATLLRSPDRPATASMLLILARGVVRTARAAAKVRGVVNADLVVRSALRMHFRLPPLSVLVRSPRPLGRRSAGAGRKARG